MKMHSFGANVLPMRDGKIPAFAWDDLQNRKQDLAEVQSYNWSGATGIAIIGGVNGFTCFDIDKAEDDQALRAIVTALGLPSDYQWQVRSGSGKGYHVWVRMSGEIAFTGRKGVIKGDSILENSFDHLELRWKDCYTVVPPSTHPSGGTYQWMYGEPTSAPETIETHIILDAFGTVATLNESKDKSKPKYIQTDYSKIISGGIPEGNRNNTVAKLAGHYKKLGIPYAETSEIIKLVNGKLESPLPEQEITTTIDSIYSYATNDIRFYTGAEMKLLKTSVTCDLVEGIIREHALVFLAGEEGSGKSLTAMNLALAVATGKDYFLNYRVAKHGKVIYLNNELHFEDFNKRFQKMITKLRPDEVARVENFIVPESMPTLEEIWIQLTRMIEEHKPVMVVLDCLYWAHDKEENDSTEMKALMRRLVELRERFGIVVLVVHHTKKGTRNETMHNDNMRGSSVFGGASDTVLMFKRSATDETKRLLKPTKLRHGNDDSRKVRLLEIEPTTLWLTDLGEADEAEHLPSTSSSGRPTAEEKIDWITLFGKDTILQRKDIVDRADKYGVSSSTVDRLLRNAGKDNTLVSAGHGKYQLPTLSSLQAA
jgi:hypothetical protein